MTFLTPGCGGTTRIPCGVEGRRTLADIKVPFLNPVSGKAVSPESTDQSSRSLTCVAAWLMPGTVSSPPCLSHRERNFQHHFCPLQDELGQEWPCFFCTLFVRGQVDLVGQTEEMLFLWSSSRISGWVPLPNLWQRGPHLVPSHRIQALGGK